MEIELHYMSEIVKNVSLILINCCAI